MKKLYEKLLSEALKLKIIHINSKILVVGGGMNDVNSLLKFGFKNAIISNVEPLGDTKSYGPYNWVKADLNLLPFDNDSFDLVIVSASLHHLSSPHRGLCEMLRVSKKVIIVIESSDNLLMKISKKLKFVPNYEIEAILKNGKGGVENSHIPNFIYRWTRQEIIKAVNSYLPHISNKFYFYYNYQFPIERLKKSRRLIFKLITPILKFFVWLISIFFPKQANELGIIIVKGNKLKKWLKGRLNKPQLDLNFIRRNYKTNL